MFHRKLLPAAAGVLMTGLLFTAPAALAGSDRDARMFAPAFMGTAFTETAANSGFTQGTQMTDSGGNHFYRDSVYTGSVSGNLISSGTMRLDLDFFTKTGAAARFVGGKFSFTDSSNSANSLSGFLQGTVDSSGNATGRFLITSGAGSFAHAVGEGTFSGPLNNASNTGTTTFNGQWTTGAHAGFWGPRPGHGFGDRNHDHFGFVPWRGNGGDWDD